MNLLLTLCLLGLLTGLPIYLLYWNLFRPVLIKRLKYRLFQCRDEMRLNLISGEIGEKEKAYPLVERFCNKAISRIDDVDLPALIAPKIDKRIEMEADRDIKLIFESPAALRRSFLQISSAVFGAACANSPGILIMFAPLFVLAVSIFWFNQTKNWATSLMKRAFGGFCLQPA
jgi:hypothetical protein